MGDLLSLFWEVDPPPIPLSFTIPSQDAECRKDDSCGTIGSFLLWYFIIILVLMFFSRASVWMSESKRDEDSGTSASLSKGSKETSCKRQSREGSWDSSLVMKKPKQNQLSTVTDSEVALVSAYLEQRRARRHSQFHRVNQIQQDSDTTECDSEESNSGASSWKESESDHRPSPTNMKRRKPVSRQRDMENYEVRERPCLHCKAMRTSEWLSRHFPPSTSVTTPMKGEIQEESLTPGTNTKLSKF